jgi:pimeloyl-ACP methyl ester carboxylesterase
LSCRCEEKIDMRLNNPATHISKFSNLASHVLVFVLLLGTALTACSTKMPPMPSLNIDTGQVRAGNDGYGTFYSYLPSTLNQNTEILVLVHGTPIDGTAEENAEFYVNSWKVFAEEHDYILIAPAFNQEDFSSRYGDHAMSGYRGLFGREIGADEWVIRLAEAFQSAAELSNAQYNLYGHSAGGQFVGRFLVMHPEKINKAVITSAATYPQPDINIKWPFGMGELHTNIEWDENKSNRVDIIPDTQNWLDATQVHLTVIVGLNDKEEIPLELIPGQKGTTRFTIARNWVKDMNTFAELNGVESQFKIELIPGIGHSMSGLMPHSQSALLTE